MPIRKIARNSFTAHEVLAEEKPNQLADGCTPVHHVFLSIRLELFATGALLCVVDKFKPFFSTFKKRKKQKQKNYSSSHMFLLSSGFLLFPPFCVVYATVICVNIKSILFFFSFFFFLIWKFCYLPTRPDFPGRYWKKNKLEINPPPFLISLMLSPVLHCFPFLSSYYFFFFRKQQSGFFHWKNDPEYDLFDLKKKTLWYCKYIHTHTHTKHGQWKASNKNIITIFRPFFGFLFFYVSKGPDESRWNRFGSLSVPISIEKILPTSFRHLNEILYNEFNWSSGKGGNEQE